MLSEIVSGNGPTARHSRSYRQHRMAIVVLVLGWIPAASLVDLLQRRLHLPIAVEYIMIALWWGAISILGCRMALWACPNCGRAFRGMLPFLPKRCRHCGHPRE
jgi:hypothetical protein